MKKPAIKSAAAKPSAPATKVPSASKDSKTTKATKNAVTKAVAAVKRAAAPLVKPVAKPAPTPVVKPVAKPSLKAAAKGAPKTPAAPVAKESSQSAPVTTTIIAAVNVGFGNSLALRGEGPGLSWVAGLPMDCTADDRWSVTLPESSQPIVCKFLINDGVWSVGEDYMVLPGTTVVLTPTF